MMNAKHSQQRFATAMPFEFDYQDDSNNTWTSLEVQGDFLSFWGLFREWGWVFLEPSRGGVPWLSLYLWTELDLYIFQEKYRGYISELLMRMCQAGQGLLES